MSRLLVASLLLVAGSLAAVPPAVAAPPNAHSALYFLGGGGDGNGNDDENSDEKARPRMKDAGSVEGEVVSVDYRTSHFSVKAGGTTYDVVVLPSTDFQGHNNSFRGITDIKKGARVNVMLSQRAATYVAQIIHLR
ncbi:MAG: hypothetical protein NVSMB19_13250 [Vulcanimicrobiaceae bacterium]